MVWSMAPIPTLCNLARSPARREGSKSGSSRSSLRTRRVSTGPDVHRQAARPDGKKLTLTLPSWWSGIGKTKFDDASFFAMARHERQRISGPCGEGSSANASTATVLRVLVFAINLWSVATLHVQARADVPDPPPYEPQFSDRAAFAEAIGKAEKYDLERQKLTGITLPHHLLAAPLIAAGLSIVDPGTVKHVLILLPDHHAVLNRSFGTTRTSFKTVFGPVNVSAAKTNALLQHLQDFEETDLFAHEHAIGALLPFVKNYLPTADIVPIAISPRSRRDDWDILVKMLAPLIDSDTLVIQSSDFSHYLSAQQAARREQETLNILAAHDYAQTALLSQPTTSTHRARSTSRSGFKSYYSTRIQT